MKMVVSVVGGAVLIAAALASTLLASDAEGAFLERCEEVLFERLVGSASYERLSVSPLERTTATFEQYAGIATPEQARRRAIARDLVPEVAEAEAVQRSLYEARSWEKASIVIEYQTTTPAQVGLANCSTFVEEGKAFAAPEAWRVSIDGYTDVDWKISEYAKAKGL